MYTHIEFLCKSSDIACLDVLLTAIKDDQDY